MEIVALDLIEFGGQQIVVDPIMYAKNGAALMDSTAMDALIEHIIPLADLLTLNIPETEKITGISIESVKAAEAACLKICELSSRAVLLKGAHALTKEATDLLFDGTHFHTFSRPRIDTTNTHRTDCTYSAAIAVYLARGYTLVEAVGLPKDYVHQAIVHSLALGQGHGPTHHFHPFYTLPKEN